MLQILNRFIDANQQQLNRYAKIVNQINDLEPKIHKLTDKQLFAKGDELKKRFLKEGKLEELLPEAFALVRESSIRNNNGERHYDVQLMAAIGLHQGNIAEQKTGEGKTLTASPAVFLNAITGKGVHVVTVNDYLARRDCGWMAPIYHALGVTCGVIIHEESFVYDPKYNDKNATDKRFKHLKPVSRKEAYAADVTYGTNNEYGFDYLRDNMRHSLDEQVQRGHYFAIVDEVDSILIDEARTPLIISQPAQEATDKYVQFTKLVQKLTAETDYVIDEKLRSASLTEYGVVKIEKLLGVDNLYEKDYATLHHIEQALKAMALFTRDKDYVVRDGEVIIVDEFTGRLMPGRRYSEGLHQAIEAKEKVQIQQESKTLASISFQNYFRMYQKLAGMTGTAATEAEEFFKIYKLNVLVMPTNRPMTRIDHPDYIYKTQSAKYTAIAKEVAEIHKSGQPVLIGTTSIEKNEFLSDLLKRQGINHAVLNAKNHEKEAEIISEAGQKGAVTVATNMAGRGVDIKLGKGVENLGGLYVIGTDKHESRRIDNQLRGRAGRQGDPGATRFFVSLEDDLMRIFGGEQVARVMTMLKVPEDMPVEHGMVSKALEGAQKKVEGHNFDARKHTVEYDDVMNQQRQIIYGVRKQILETIASKDKNDTGLKEEILGKVRSEIEKIVLVNAQEEIDYQKIIADFTTIILFDDKSKADLLTKLQQLSSSDEIIEFLLNLSREFYDAKETMLTPEVMRQMENGIYLQTIDMLWMEHLDTMDDLRAGIGLRGYAQRDPLVEYKKEGFELFERLIASIDSDVVHSIYKAVPNNSVVHMHPVVDLSQLVEKHDEALDEDLLREETGQLISGVDKLEIKEKNLVPDLPYNGTKITIDRGDGRVEEQMKDDSTGALVSQHRVGRNEPCWCGSGKKYKKCHYPN